MKLILPLIYLLSLQSVQPATLPHLPAHARQPAGTDGSVCRSAIECRVGRQCLQIGASSTQQCTPSSAACVCVTVIQQQLGCSCAAPCADGTICDAQLAVCVPAALQVSPLPCATAGACASDADCAPFSVCRDGAARCRDGSALCRCVAEQGGGACNCEQPCPLGDICARENGRNVCRPIEQNPSPIRCEPGVGVGVVLSSPIADDPSVDPVAAEEESEVVMMMPQMTMEAPPPDVPPPAGSSLIESPSVLPPGQGTGLGGSVDGLPLGEGDAVEVDAADGSLFTMEFCSRTSQCAGDRRCVTFGADTSCGGGEVCQCVLEDVDDSRCSCEDLTCAVGDVCSVEGESASECISANLEPTELECASISSTQGGDTAEMATTGQETPAAATITPEISMEPVVAETVEPVLDASVEPTAEVTPVTTEGVCVDAKRLAHLDAEDLVFERDVMSRVLCDAMDSCATSGHMVTYHGQSMMMKSYCELVGCQARIIAVNSPRYRRGVRVQSGTHGLYFTAFAARYETRVEEKLMATAVHLGL